MATIQLLVFLVHVTPLAAFAKTVQVMPTALILLLILVLMRVLATLRRVCELVTRPTVSLLECVASLHVA